jgi:hypothetical protein
MQPDRHPDNVPGDFYVDRSCCLMCGATSAEAPDLIGTDEGSRCFVKRQPTSPDEIYRMLRAIWVAEVEGVRYAGADEGMLRRIAEAGMKTACDRRCALEVTAVCPTTVLIGRPLCASDESPAAAARSLMTRLREQLGRAGRMRTSFRSSPEGAELLIRPDRRRLGQLERSFTERDGGGAVLTARPAPESRGGVVVRVSDADRRWMRSTLVSIDEALRGAPGLTSIRWFDESEWADPDCRGRPYPM